MNKRRDLCVTCLSSDRWLFPLNKMGLFKQELKFLKIKMPDCHICWECMNTIKKFHKFRNQVCAANRKFIVASKTEVFKSLSNLTTSSFLTVCIGENGIDLTDPLNDDSTEYHDFFNTIKENYSHNDDDCDNMIVVNNKIEHDNKNIFTKFHENGIEDMFNEQEPKIVVSNDYGVIDNSSVGLNVENNHHIGNVKDGIMEAFQKDTKATRTDAGKDMEKFRQVEMTEEEVARDRDKKRNHPNYKKIPFKCEFCVLGFASKDNLDAHMKKKHDVNIGPETCTICQVRFPTSRSLVKHRQRHYLFYKCLLCDHKSVELRTIVEHCKKKHQNDKPNRIHCQKCDAVFMNLEDLNIHMHLEHAAICDLCGDKFRGADTLRRHKARIHLVPRPYVCDICTKKFKTKMRLESHMTGHDAATAKRLAYCHQCKVQFKNIMSYRAHLRTSFVHSQETHKCPKCEKWFPAKTLMKRHYEFYHLRKSKHRCESCDKPFLSNWLLKDHKKKYHGLERVKSHQCDICNKKFYDKSILRGHMMIHLEQRSYMCEDCGDTFKQRAALYTHARLVHTAKPTVKKKNK